jgi:ribonuclease HII
MVGLHQQYPQYGFDRHKGYSTVEHIELLERHGPCPQHRRSFEPVARLLQGRIIFG